MASLLESLRNVPEPRHPFDSDVTQKDTPSTRSGEEVMDATVRPPPPTVKAAYFVSATAVESVSDDLEEFGIMR